MTDQAHQLRSLKMQAALNEAGAAPTRPQVIAATGGKGGVGISTLVINLAVALAHRGRRPLIVSASEQPHDIEMMCGLGDVQAETSAAAVKPVQGPAGTLLLSVGEAVGAESRMRRVFSGLAAMGNCADIAVVDAGTRMPWDEHLPWNDSDALFYVTTSDNVAVMDTYAAIKQFVGTPPRATPRLGLLVNRSCGPGTAKCTHDRIAATCRRFLATPLRFVGDVPDDPSLCPVRASAMPAVLQPPTTRAAQAIDQIAATVTRKSW